MSTREHPGYPQCPCLVLDTESEDLVDFRIENGKPSQIKMFSTTANNSRTTDELDGDTTV